jgi:hypothetical protein
VQIQVTVQVVVQVVVQGMAHPPYAAPGADHRCPTALWVPLWTYRRILDVCTCVHVTLYIVAAPSG